MKGLTDFLPCSLALRVLMPCAGGLVLVVGEGIAVLPVDKRSALPLPGALCLEVDYSIPRMLNSPQ